MFAGTTVCPPGTSCAFSSAGTALYSLCTDGRFSGWAVQPASVAFALPYNSSQASRQPTSAPVGAACLACPDGYSCSAPYPPPAVGQAAPALCPGSDAGAGGARYHYRSTAYEVCPLCPAGSACALPNALPQLCPAGSFSQAGAARCVSCPAGFSCTGGASTLQVPCLPGAYAVEGNGSCTLCAPGFACPDATVDAGTACALGTVADAGAVDCVPCLPGRACPLTNATAASSLCAPGTFSAGGAANCTACPAGSAGAKAGGESQSAACAPCAPGTYSPRPGQSACAACPQDTHCPLEGAVAPTVCPAGTSTAGASGVALAAGCVFAPPPPSPPPPPRCALPALRVGCVGLA